MQNLCMAGCANLYMGCRVLGEISKPIGADAICLVRPQSRTQKIHKTFRSLSVGCNYTAATFGSSGPPLKRFSLLGSIEVNRMKKLVSKGEPFMGGFNEGGGDSSRDKKDANEGGGISDKVHRDNERDSVSGRGNRGTSNNSENGNSNSESGSHGGEAGNEGGEAGNEGGESGNEGGGENPNPPRDCDPVRDEAIPRPRKRDNDYVWPLPEFQPPTVRISASGGYGTEVRPSGPSSVAEPIVGVSGGASVLPVLEIGP